MKNNSPALLLEPIEISGDGTSLWGESRGAFSITQYKFNSSVKGEEVPYELQLFGPTTKWHQYTDNNIVKEVNEKLMTLVKTHYPQANINHISWSEYGMQPDNGWSFDICLNPPIS